jgi:2-polyprenyl-6-methoxyphenol hydroxylase-like FAD-dependent oxidoreductase
MSEKHVVVVGGSVAGLATGIALHRSGHRVTLLERDATPLPASPGEAFFRWNRAGSPQTRHSHAFLARLHNLLAARAPEVLELLLAHGVGELRFHDMVREIFESPAFEPEDDEITLLACRRITFEWVLRRYVSDLGRVELRDGVRVDGLASAPDEGSGLPRATGVLVRRPDGSHATVEADLVVDASGRRSKLPEWLAAIGARAPREDSEPCGIFYSTRFYQRRPGVAGPRATTGVMGADLGYLKWGVFPGDDGTFSVTLCASPDDPELRPILHPRPFELAAGLVPATREWVDPAVAEPLTEVHGMGDLRNTRRFLVEDGAPLALGVVAVGDALIHTNPLNGRGCTLAWIHACCLADALAEHPEDPRALALSLDARVAREIVPWYEATRVQDRDAIEVSAIQREGGDPFAFQREDGGIEPKAYMRSLVHDGFIPGLREDLVLLRTFMRMFNLLEPPEDLMKRPEVLQRVIAAWGRRHTREREVVGPTREEMVEHLRSAA